MAGRVLGSVEGQRIWTVNLVWKDSDDMEWSSRIGADFYATGFQPDMAVECIGASGVMPDDDEFAADREKWESNEFASAFFDWWHQIKAPPAPDGPPLTYPIRGDRIWLSVECKILRSR